MIAARPALISRRDGVYPHAMDWFVVERAHGPAWDAAVGLREQVSFAEHAEFVDDLVDKGSIVFGGPVGEGDGDFAVLIFEAENAAEIEALLVDDPWPPEMLYTASIRRWNVVLRRDRAVPPPAVR